VRYLNEMFSPHELGRHWQTQNEYVPGQAGNLRAGPDKVIRNFAGTVFSALYGGIRYFIDRVRGFKPLLVSVDFNGNGTKTGFAGLGFTDADYWNVYAAGAFNWLNNVNGCYGYYYYYYAYGICGQTKVFNKNPQTFLKDSTNIKSPVWLERVAAATAASGTYTVWDAMASTWIGGWSGGVIPEENFFALRGLPAGTYRLACYASNFGRPIVFNTAFYVAVDNGVPAVKTTAVTAVPAFLENYNYVLFDVTVPAGGIVTVTGYGYFDGLQIERLS
jgi:hypothetical protein